MNEPLYIDVNDNRVRAIVNNELKLHSAKNGKYREVYEQLNDLEEQNNLYISKLEFNNAKIQELKGKLPKSLYTIQDNINCLTNEIFRCYKDKGYDNSQIKQALDYVKNIVMSYLSVSNFEDIEEVEETENIEKVEEIEEVEEVEKQEVVLDTEPVKVSEDIEATVIEECPIEEATTEENTTDQQCVEETSICKTKSNKQVKSNREKVKSNLNIDKYSMKKIKKLQKVLHNYIDITQSDLFESTIDLLMGIKSEDEDGDGNKIVSCQTDDSILKLNIVDINSHEVLTNIKSVNKVFDVNMWKVKAEVIKFLYFLNLQVYNKRLESGMAGTENITFKTSDYYNFVKVLNKKFNPGRQSKSVESMLKFLQLIKILHKYNNKGNEKILNVVQKFKREDIKYNKSSIKDAEFSVELNAGFVEYIIFGGKTTISYSCAMFGLDEYDFEICRAVCKYADESTNDIHEHRLRLGQILKDRYDSVANLSGEYIIPSEETKKITEYSKLKYRLRNQFDYMLNSIYILQLIGFITNFHFLCDDGEILNIVPSLCYKNELVTRDDERKRLAFRKTISDLASLKNLELVFGKSK